MAALADNVKAGCKAAQIVGWVVFTRVITYSNFADWKADFGLHRVDEDSLYAFQKGKNAWKRSVTGFAWPTPLFTDTSA